MKTNVKKVALILAVTSGIVVLLQLTYLHFSGDNRTQRGISEIRHDPDFVSLEDLHEMISGTQGFYARDWSLWLGWNNVRFIIEASVLHAQILNRTLVLPSYVYARDCEFEIEVCAAYYDMVNRGDALEDDEWRDLPPDQQMGWLIPLSTMIDLTLLRQRQPVVLVSEYLKLHGLPASLETSKGNWDRQTYHSGRYIFPSYKNRWIGNYKKPSLSVIVNTWFDPEGVVRVDMIPEEMKKRGGWNSHIINSEEGRRGEWKEIIKTDLYEKLDSERRGDAVLEWWRALVILENNGFDISTDENVRTALQNNGWEVLHTYEGKFYEHTKTVTEPLLQVAPRDSIRGLDEDFKSNYGDVLLLEGETHWNRKPGNLRFTTEDGQSEFTRTVLRFIQPPRRVLHLADKLSDRMKSRVDGRLWMGAHMRRGDFVKLGWSSSSSMQEHLRTILSKLRDGRKKIIEIQRENEIKTFDVPDATPDTALLTNSPPEYGDLFYLATDERTADNLKYLKHNSAILLEDLLTPEDRREYGPELVITDILGLIDQALLSRSSYFHGSYTSSLSGGVINMRAALGLDHRTHSLDK